MNHDIVLIEDTRQQADKHILKHNYFDANNIKVVRSKLPVGDYADMKNMSVVIDTKKDIQEIISNVTTQHERFRAECDLAAECGIQLIILIENKNNINEIKDLAGWYNWRLKRNKRATTGKQLMKILYTMEEKHAVKFAFCRPEESGEKILELLNLKY
jgi:ribosome-associated protein